MLFVTISAGREEFIKPGRPREQFRADPDVVQMNPVTAATRQEPATSPTPDRAGVGAAWAGLRRLGHAQVVVRHAGSGDRPKTTLTP